MSPPAGTSSRLLNGVTVVLGAFLLFLVQPMAAKAILPWFGGSAAVWIVCLLFFQSGLLLGYLYAHGLFRFVPPRSQAWIHLALLAIALCLLPVNPGARWKPAGQEAPALRILELLTVSLGLPCVMLGSTSPLVQAWHARSNSEALPWRLFALSNLGSLVALLSYPFAVEPFVGVRRQMHTWSAAFAAYVLVFGAVAWKSARAATAAPEALPEPKGPGPAAGDVALWVLLSAAASTLLMAVSGHLTQNVAAMPFLWVLPLALYLLTFILCFEGRRWYRRAVFVPLQLAGAGVIALYLGPDMEGTSLRIVVPVFAAGLFVCCMACHGELAWMKPAPRHLTAFYLSVSAGGALGGVFVGLVAPQVFSAGWELPIGLFAAVVLALAAIRRRPSETPRFKALWNAGAVAALALAIGLLAQADSLQSSCRLMVRGFYGALRVTDVPSYDGSGTLRLLRHGTIIHGQQYLDSERGLRPNSYYSPWSGAGLALTREPRPAGQKIGIIGLGCGTLSVYGRPGDQVVFYEIDPLVVDLANSEFTYLADSPARVDIVPGDARLSLEREPARDFDVLCVDAFSGDSIPTHLLTREAFALYRRHVKPGGIIAVHVTNRYLDLAPVVAQAAAGLGLAAVRVEAFPDRQLTARESVWVLVCETTDAFVQKDGWNVVTRLAPDPRIRPWTDDDTSLFGVLKR